MALDKSNVEKQMASVTWSFSLWTRSRKHFTRFMHISPLLFVGVLQAVARDFRHPQDHHTVLGQLWLSSGVDHYSDHERDVGDGKRRLGGSALAQAYGQMGDESLDVDNA